MKIGFDKLFVYSMLVFMGFMLIIFTLPKADPLISKVQAKPPDITKHTFDAEDEALAIEMFPVSKNCDHVMLRRNYLASVYPYMARRYKNKTISHGQKDFYNRSVELYKICKGVVK